MPTAHNNVKLQAIGMLRESVMALNDALSDYKGAVETMPQDEARALQELKLCMRGSHGAMHAFLKRLGERP